MSKTKVHRAVALASAVFFISSSQSWGQLVSAGGAASGSAMATSTDPDANPVPADILDYQWYSLGNGIDALEFIAPLNAHVATAATEANVQNISSTGSYWPVTFQQGTLNLGSMASVENVPGQSSTSGQVQILFRFRNTSSSPVQVTAMGTAYADAGQFFSYGDSESAYASSIVSGPFGLLAHSTATYNGFITSGGGTNGPITKTGVLLPGQAAAIGISTLTNASTVATTWPPLVVGSANAQWSVNASGTVTVPTLDPSAPTGSTWQNNIWLDPPTGSTFPSGSCVRAYLPPRATATTLTINSPGITLGHLGIAGAGSYTVDGPSSITLACPNGVSMDVISGEHTVNADVNVDNESSFDVDATSGSGKLTLGGAVTFASGIGATKTGTGTLQVNNVRADHLSVLGGSVRIAPNGGSAGASKVSALNIAFAGSKLNLTDNTLIVDYSTSSPIAEIANWIKTGYAAGAWTGDGIVGEMSSQKGIGYAESSLVVGSSGGTYRGQSVDGTAVIARIVYAGDTNLDGTVNFGDMLVLASNYNMSGKSWSDGDFNYDGVVNFSDQLSLAANYNLTLAGTYASAVSPTGSFASDWALAWSLVPEPSALSAVMGLAVVSLRRRRA
ncbi:MAG: hypothetical protein QM770_22250 [Tepidisphaeraceae bacterium]